MTVEARKQVKKLIAEEEYEQAFALLTQLSIQDPELEALLLIKSEKFEQALSKGVTCFEAAYCHYRLGDYDKALKELQSSNEKRDLILKGQIYYKIGKYEEALKMYSQALQVIGKHEEEGKNVLVNFYACKAALAWSPQAISHHADDDSAAFLEECNAYEIMYNRGIELMSQDKEDASLLFKAAAAMQQRDDEQVDPAVQYNLDLCLGNPTTSTKETISLINSAISGESVNKTVKILKKELHKRKMPVFQKQLAVEQLIIRAVDEKKYHTAFNLSKLIDDHQRIQSHLNLAIKKCRSLKDVPVNEANHLTLNDLEKLIQ